MTFTPKDWRDFPDTSTPITAAALEDLETRLAAHASARTPLLVAAAGAPAPIIAAADYVCDGTADEVQINAALTAAAGAREVLLSPGTFTLSDSVSAFVSGSVLRGAGRTTLLVISAAITGKHIVHAAGANGSELIAVQVTDLRVKGYGDNGAGGAFDHGVRLSYCDRSRVERITGHDVTWSIVQLDNCRDCTVHALTSEIGSLGANPSGWYCLGISNPQVGRSTAYHAGHRITGITSTCVEHAVSATYADNLIIDGIVSVGNNLDAVVNLQACQEVLVTNVAAKDAAQLFFVEPWTDPTSRSSANITLSNSRMRKAATGTHTLNAVQIVDAVNMSLHNLHLTLTGQTSGYGVRFDGTSDGANITDCVVDDAASHGIYIDAACDDLNLAGCTVINCGGDGVRTNAANRHRLIGNRCAANTGSGIYCSSVDFIIAENLCTSNGNDGITLAYADDGLTVNNRCRSNTSYGIELLNSNCERNIVKDNHLAGNTAGAILDTGTNTRLSTNYGETLPTVASATTVTLAGSDVQTISGTTTITSITASPHVGRMVTLIFSGALTLTDGSNLKLAGNFVTTADDAITLVSDGTNWIEVARTVN